MNKHKQKTITEVVEAYALSRVTKIGTVSVDTGTIVILDPCRIGRIAATEDHDDLLGSPLYPDNGIKPGQRMDDSALARQVVDPPLPAKENPKEPKDYGKTGGNALSLHTGFGDGEYSVFAEIVSFPPPIGERIAAIYIQFLADEDIEATRKQVDAHA